MDDQVRRRFTPPPLVALDAAQRDFHRKLTTGPRAAAGDVPMVAEDGALLGPFAVMAIAPVVGQAVQEVGAAVRYGTRLDPRLREAAVLLVAAHHRCAFERFAHEPVARRLGLDDSALTSLRRGAVPEGLPPRTSQALHVVATMLRTGTIGDADYSGAVVTLGEDGLAELVWLTGYYSMLALALAVFDPPVPGRDAA